MWNDGALRRLLYRSRQLPMLPWRSQRRALLLLHGDSAYRSASSSGGGGSGSLNRGRLQEGIRLGGGPECTWAEHIADVVPPSASTSEAFRTAMDDLYTRLSANTSFAEFARRHTDTPAEKRPYGFKWVSLYEAWKEHGHLTMWDHLERLGRKNRESYQSYLNAMFSAMSDETWQATREILRAWLGDNAPGRASDPAPSAVASAGAGTQIATQSDAVVSVLRDVERRAALTRMSDSAQDAAFEIAAFEMLGEAEKIEWHLRRYFLAEHRDKARELLDALQRLTRSDGGGEVQEFYRQLRSGELRLTDAEISARTQEWSARERRLRADLNTLRQAKVDAEDGTSAPAQQMLTYDPDDKLDDIDIDIDAEGSEDEAGTAELPDVDRAQLKRMRKAILQYFESDTPELTYKVKRGTLAGASVQAWRDADGGDEEGEEGEEGEWAQVSFAASDDGPFVSFLVTDRWDKRALVASSFMKHLEYTLACERDASANLQLAPGEQDAFYVDSEAEEMEDD